MDLRARNGEIQGTKLQNPGHKTAKSRTQNSKIQGTKQQNPGHKTAKSRARNTDIREQNAKILRPETSVSDGVKAIPRIIAIFALPSFRF